MSKTNDRLRVHLHPRHTWHQEGRVLRENIASRIDARAAHQARPRVEAAPLTCPRQDDTPSVLSLIGLVLVVACAMAGALLF